MAISNITPILNSSTFKARIAGDEVIIGDEQSPTFKPQITFTKWNKENSLTIKPAGQLAIDLADATPTLTNGKVEVKKQKVGFYFNPSPDNENEFKFGLILNYTPKNTDTWDFQLEGWEDLDFFYQPPLKNISPDGSTWEYNNHGGISSRPAEVNGSYAVYHKTKKNHIIGQTNYMCGKVGHIYRPRLLDADGVFLGWVDLLIQNGNYHLSIVNIPQATLDNAKLPLKFNDWFGSQTPGGSNDTLTSINAWYLKAQSTPASSGALTSISFYCSYIDAGSTFDPAIYSTVSSIPGARLAYSDSGGTAAGSSLGWITTNLDYASIVAGTQYWLGVLTSTSTKTFNVKYDTATDELYKTAGATGYPDPAGTTGHYDERVSIYATYTASGASVALTGTITTATEADIVAGGKTIILTLSGDTWLTSAGGLFDAQRQNIIDGLDSAQSEATGWDAEVKAKIAVTDVVRTSDTIVTITLDAEAGYNTTANETITATIPYTATTLTLAPIVASPTFTVTYIPVTSTTGEVYPTSATASAIGAHIDDTWVRTAAILTAGAGTVDAACISASSFDAGDQSYVLKASNFDFSGILAGSQIKGVICRFEGWANTSGATATSCGLDYAYLLDTSRVETGENWVSGAVGFGTTVWLSATTQIVSIGNSANLWSCALTADWVKNANFGVALGFIAQTANTDLWVDYVTLEIVYEPAAPVAPLSLMYTFIEC